MLTYILIGDILDTHKEGGLTMPMKEIAIDERIDLSSESYRKKLSLVMTRLFDHWNLQTTQQLNLLGLSENSRSLLGKYRKGSPLPSNRDILDRIGWLLAIHKALRLFYPKNEKFRYTWVTRRNKAFENKTPLDVMMEEGLIGISKVSRFLDHQRGL